MLWFHTNFHDLAHALLTPPPALNVPFDDLARFIREGPAHGVPREALAAAWDRLAASAQRGNPRARHLLAELAELKAAA